MRYTFLILAGVCMIGLSSGCKSKLQDERDQLYAQNQELQKNLNDAEARARSAADPSALNAARADIAARDAEIAKLQDQLRNNPGGAKDPSLEGIDATYDPKSGNITVNLPGDVLFASGEADLKSSATATLDKVIGAIKKSYPGKMIFVDGHTDSDKITRTKDKWADNHDLSYHRAKAVMDYLTKHGIADKQIALRAFGPNKPKATKAASRRVEIVVATR